MAARKTQNGPKGDKLWKQAIMIAVNKEYHGEKPGEKFKILQGIADAVAKAALKGDVAAAKEIGDRLDGKATQPVSHGIDGLEGFLDRLNGAKISDA